MPESVLPASVRDKIQLPEKAAVMVDPEILTRAFSALTAETPIIEVDYGAEFYSFTRASGFNDLQAARAVIEQTITRMSTTAPVMGVGVIIATGISGRLYRLYSEGAWETPKSAKPAAVSMSPAEHKERRIEAWLDTIDWAPGHKDELGIMLRINRLLDSFEDWCVIWVPLGIRVVDINKPA